MSKDNLGRKTNNKTPQMFNSKQKYDLRNYTTQTKGRIHQIEKTNERKAVLEPDKTKLQNLQTF